MSGLSSIFDNNFKLYLYINVSIHSIVVYDNHNLLMDTLFLHHHLFGVEIYPSSLILSTCDPIELHLIDIWKGSMCSADENGMNMIHVPDMEVVYNQIQEKYEIDDRVYVIRDNTTILETYEDDYFDFIYVDAEHSFKSVYQDLGNALHKSKRYIGGHDYCNAFYEVVKAVDLFCEHNRLHINYITQDGCPSFLIDLENQ